MAAWSGPNSDRRSHQSTLSLGICNFADLTRSHDAPKCGCRRFWPDSSRQSTSRDSIESAWCFCGHHACFHDQDQKSDPAGQESRLSPSARNQHHTVTGADAGAQRVLSQEGTMPWARPSSSRNAGLGLQHAPIQPGIWDALNAYQRRFTAINSNGSSALPSTAPPSTAPPSTAPPSTAPPSVLASQAYSSPPNVTGQAVDPIRHGYTAAQVDTNDTATEINTPSLDGTPRLTRPSPLAMAQRTDQTPLPDNCLSPPLFPPSPDRRQNSASVTSPDPQTQCQRPSAAAVDRPMPRAATQGPSIRELEHLVKSCTKRIDFLESLSYTHVPLEEVEDRFEQIDGRLISLEDFRHDVESRLPSQGPDTDSQPRTRRLLPAEATASFNSDDCVSQESSHSSSSGPSAAAAAIYAEYNTRLETLQARIDILEASLPSPRNPWRIEVVILPWGRHLPGIWQSTTSTDWQDDPTNFGEEWNGAQNSAHGILAQGSSNPTGWSTDSIQAWADNAKDWLNPKACGPNGIVYQRLWSRGLVQEISIESADAHTLMNQCCTAFAQILSRIHSTTPASSSSQHGYDALRASLIPLRKVKKVSRLRFLTPGEMVSSAIWTPAFLEASVFMHARGRQRRLYMTFPDSYIQQTDGWTWQTIRALRPKRHAVPHSGPGFDGATTKTDAEACWEYHPVYDAPRSVEQSFISDTSRQSLWSIKSQVSHQTVRQADPVPSPMVSPVSQARTFRSPRRRTVSVPTSEEEPSSSAPVKTKRRVASFEQAALQSKKRRTSTSSSMQRPGPGPAGTPRYSREPPSPFASDHRVEKGSESTSTRRVTTPLAYETPHSHNNTHNPVILGHGDGDTEADTEIAGQELWTGREEDEWQLERHEDVARAAANTHQGNSETYQQEEEDLDDEVDVGDADEVLESLVHHMRESYSVCRTHKMRNCDRCPKVEHRYSLRSGTRGH